MQRYTADDHERTVAAKTCIGKGTALHGRSIHNDDACLPEIAPTRVKSKLTDAETQRCVENVIGIYQLCHWYALRLAQESVIAAASRSPPFDGESNICCGHKKIRRAARKSPYRPIFRARNFLHDYATTITVLGVDRSALQEWPRSSCYAFDSLFKGW